VTWLTYDIFITFIFGWSSFWLFLFVVITALMPGLEPSDYEVMGFRASIAFVCLSVFIRRWFDTGQIVLIPAFSIFAWTAMATTVRLIIKRCCLHPRTQCLIPQHFCSSLAP